jgi:TonB C terminal
MVARRIEVDDFGPLAAPRVVCRVTRTPSTVNRSRLAGLCGTLLLHGLVVSMFIPTTSIHKRRAPDAAGATVLHPVTAPADELVIINVFTPSGHNDEPVATTVDLRSQLAKPAFPLVTPDRMPPIDLSIVNADAENSAQSEANPVDAKLRARMFGRYTEQISARIQRAWEKPTSPVKEPNTGRSEDAVFVCQVQIRQDNRGNVQEVLLLACNGTEAWRHSLVVAINQSSPLPAPPIPGVFQRALTMTFAGQEGHRESLAGTGE